MSQNCFQIKCALEDLGYPFATKVKWHHNGREIAGRHSYIMTIREADVSAGGNYTWSIIDKYLQASQLIMLVMNSLDFFGPSYPPP